MKKRRWKRLIFFGGVFVALFLYLRYQQKGAILDEAKLSGKLEAAVNDILARNGVRDQDIGHSIHTERLKKFPIPVSWVESEREVRIAKPAALPQILRQVRAACVDLKLDEIRESKDAGRTVLECGKKGRLFQCLIFIPGSGAKAKSKKVAIVIDDVAGRPGDLERLEGFLALGIPITYAVMPMEKESRSTAEKIHGSRQEVILHQPMEPADAAHNSPGKAALLTQMKRKEIQEQLRENLQTVPHAVGLSNHMGSRFTAEEKAMKTLFASIRKLKGGLFFFDSHTSPKIVSGSLAKKAKLAYVSNDVFLDSTDEVDAIAKQLDALKARALKKGSAAGIGHIQRKNTVEALRRSIPEFRKAGVESVHLSELAREGGRR